MRKLVVVLLLICGGAVLRAQTTALTGVIKDLTGTPVSSGRITFTLRPPGVSNASGIGSFVSTTVSCLINASGTQVSSADGVSPCIISNNTLLTPTGTYYQLCIQPQNVSPGSCLNFFALGGTVDITTLVPTPATQPAFGIASTNLANTWTQPQAFPGGISGPLTGPSICTQYASGTYEATCFPGVDPTGLTDSTAGLQTAIWTAWGNSYAPTGSFGSNLPYQTAYQGGGKLHIGKGKYKTTGTLWIPSHLIVEGDGSAQGLSDSGNIGGCGDPSTSIGSITTIDYEPASANYSTYALQSANFNITPNGTGSCTVAGGCVGGLITSSASQSSGMGSTITGVFGNGLKSLNVCTNVPTWQVKGGVLFTGNAESSWDDLSVNAFQSGLVWSYGWTNRLHRLKSFSDPVLASGGIGLNVAGNQNGTTIDSVYADADTAFQLFLTGGYASGLTTDSTHTAFSLQGPAHFSGLYAEGVSQTIIMDNGNAANYNGEGIVIDSIQINSPNAVLYQNTAGGAANRYQTWIRNPSVFQGNLHALLGTYDAGTSLEIDGIGLTANDTLPTALNVVIRPSPTTWGTQSYNRVDTASGFEFLNSIAAPGSPYAYVNFYNQGTGSFQGYSDWSMTRLINNVAEAQGDINQAYLWGGFDTTNFTCLGVPGSWNGTGAENSQCELKIHPQNYPHVLMSCVTGSIGGSALAAGASVSGTCALSGSASVTGHPGYAAATDGSAQGNYPIAVSVVGTTATVTLTAITAGTPTAKTYNVTVF
jgi:hypothetical protein